MGANVPEDVAKVQRNAKAAEPLQSIHEKIVVQAASEIVVRAQSAGRGNLQ